MNIILISDKIVASTIETIIKHDSSVELLTTITAVKSDIVDTIIDYDADAIILVRGVPFRTKLMLEEIVADLREVAPNIRVIYVYGEVTKDYEKVSQFLMNSGIYDVVTGQTTEYGFLNLLANPMTPEDALSEQKRTLAPKPAAPRKSRPVPKRKETLAEALSLDLETDENENDAAEETILGDGENLIIGIAELFHHNGSTHTALELATTLAIHENSVCVLIGDSETCGVLENIKDNGCIDIFHYSELEDVRGEYTYIVCDFGLLDGSCSSGFEQCDVKIMLCCAADWNIARLKNFIETSDDAHELHYCFYPIARTKFIRLSKQFAREKYRPYRLKASNDWSLPCDENCAVYVDIIKRHLNEKSPHGEERC